VSKLLSVFKGLALACGLAVGLGALAPSVAYAQDPSFVTVSAGYYDFNRQKDPAWEAGMQYRSNLKLWVFQPMVGFMHNGNGSTDLYAGISLDLFFGNRFVIRPSFAPSYYNRGGGQDLGDRLEFRSAIEFAYRFDDRSRLGLEVYHMSNASLGTINPGEESINVVYSLPTNKIASWFGN
jgi:lipid A 3-O-deacylase